MAKPQFVQPPASILRTIFLRNFVPAATDCLLVIGSVLLAYRLRFSSVATNSPDHLLNWMQFMIAIRIISNICFGVYRLSWQFFGLREASRLCGSSLAVTAFVLTGQTLGFGESVLREIPPDLIVFEGLSTLIAMLGLRTILRISLAKVHAQRRCNHEDPAPLRTLLIGAGRAGILALRELRARPDLGYRPIAWVDDNTHKKGLMIEGLPVFCTSKNIEEIAESLGAQAILLTLPSVNSQDFNRIVDRCRKTRLPVHTIPTMSELLSGNVHISRIRPVRIEDVLGRPEIPMDGPHWQRVTQNFGGKRILVTGAGGSIGSELCRQLCTVNPSALIMVENHENNLFEIDNDIRGKIGSRAFPCLVDIRNRDRMLELFELHRPHVVFHAAAFKHVPMMELHPSDAILNNVQGTKIVAEIASQNHVESFVFVSTDKAVNPTNIMGASKRIAELVVLALAHSSTTRFSCVRFGNVLGSRGSVLHIFRKQIEEGGPVTVTDAEITRFFMTIPEAVRLVIQAGAYGKGGEVFLLDMGDPVKIIDLARQMIQLTGFSEDEIPVQIVGLRPGEKLHEELLLADEGATASEVEKIWLARPQPADFNRIDRLVQRLFHAASHRDHPLIRQILSDADIGYHTSGRDSRQPQLKIPAQTIIESGTVLQSTINGSSDASKSNSRPSPAEIASELARAS